MGDKILNARSFATPYHCNVVIENVVSRITLIFATLGVSVTA